MTASVFAAVDGVDEAYNGQQGVASASTRMSERIGILPRGEIPRGATAMVQKNLNGERYDCEDW